MVSERCIDFLFYILYYILFYLFYFTLLFLFYFILFYFIYFILLLFMAIPAAYGSSQAKELQLLGYTTATATWDLSWVCTLHYSSQQRWILNPLHEARDRTSTLMDPSQVP